MAAELEELRKVQEEFFTHSIELEDTQQELENLGIANEQLMTDIEEKNLVVDEAKEKAARYEQMDLPLFTLDQDGNILTWNKTAASVTGYIPELALDESISFMFEDKDNFDIEHEVMAPLRENFKLRLEIPIKKPNGNVFNALISLASFKDRNGIISTLGYLVNLSDTENEDDVKAVRRHFTTLLGSSGLTLLTLSPGYLISDMNEKAGSTFQWNREDTLGKNFFEIILSQENWEEVSSDIQGRMDTQASVELEAQAMLKDKIKHSFLWTLVKEVDPKDESVQGILAIARDVTDIHEAQNELRENKLLMNMFLDKSDDGVISIDENGIIQSFSDGAENLFGYTSDEIIGKNISQLMPDPYSKEHDNYIRRYVDTGDSTFIGGPPKELTGKNKSGTTFPVEITLKEIYKNYQRLFIGIVRDIRKRKEVEIQLAKNQEKYHRFMDAQSDAVLVVDGGSQQILECNPAASQLCGYEPEEFMNLNFKDLVATTDQGADENGTPPITGLGSSYKIPQIYMVKKDGSLFPAKINTSSFRFEDTEYEFKIIRDISTEVELNEILEQNEKLKIDLREEKSNMVDHIASSVVDLINNPIQGIESILAQVKERAEMADIHKGLVTVAMNECRRVANLIGKLKSFQPPTKENLESLNVHKVLDEVIQGNMNKINDRTITLEKNYANHLPSIEGVTPQIRQAIDNIVKNAEEALSEDEGKIIISTEQVGSNVKIHIKDTGCGIAENDMSRIFEPFFTTKSAMHRPGLGLLATLGIVKNHKGNINVQSDPGEGTTFTVTLPLKQPLNQNGGS
jgi:PAS domain S-box-containing protein